MRLSVAFLAFALVACGSSTPKPVASTAPAPSTGTTPKAIADALADPDRDPEDRALDAGRKPGELLAFFDIKPGAHVAELAAGRGYTAELLARVVGPTGAVFAENPKTILERFAQEPWTKRLQKPVMKNVVRVDRELDDPLPPEAKNLDAVLCILFYHDTVWLGADRARMNKAVFDALKSGGLYGIVDHAGRDGTGVTEASTLHRIEEKVVRDEVLAAGFRLQKEGTFLRNPSDPRDWNPSPSKAGEKRGTSDRFVLAFVKP